MEDDPIVFTKTIQLTLLGLTAAALSSGCAHLYDPIDESISRICCQVEAAQTWHYLRHDYSQVAYPHHFGAGFRAGYVNVCRGRGTCPPTLPPKSYWKFWYRNPAGREKAVEWFNGFAAGAAAAVHDGHDVSGEIVTAPGLCDCSDQYQFAPSPGYVPPTETSIEPPESPWQLAPTGPGRWLPDNAVEQLPPVPPVDRVPMVDRRNDSASVKSESETTTAPDVSSTPLPPFGHSIGPDSSIEDQVSPEQRSEVGETAPSDRSKQSPKHRTDGEMIRPKPRVPSTDGLLVPEFKTPPENELPYLEDRFLPRGTGSQTRNIYPPGRSRQPRSLLEAIAGVQQTSFATPQPSAAR